MSDLTVTWTTNDINIKEEYEFFYSITYGGEDGAVSSAAVTIREKGGKTDLYSGPFFFGENRKTQFVLEEVADTKPYGYLFALSLSGDSAGVWLDFHYGNKNLGSFLGISATFPLQQTPEEIEEFNKEKADPDASTPATGLEKINAEEEKTRAEKKTVKTNKEQVKAEAKPVKANKEDGDTEEDKMAEAPDEKPITTEE